MSDSCAAPSAPQNKLEKLALAIKKHEGWIEPGSPGYPRGSISFRNNNPGNLRYSPKQSGSQYGFSKFPTYAAGWNALIWDLTQKCHGNTRTGLNGQSTLMQLLAVYAPAADHNNPEAYMMFVQGETGFPPTMKLAELLN